MKFLLVLFVVCFFSLEETFGQKYTTGEVIHVQGAEKGTVILNSVGYGSNKAAASKEAKAKAVKTLIFQGIPGSAQPQALVADESQSISENKEFYKSLFEDGRYETFIMKAFPITPLKREMGRKQMIVQIQVNVAALRKDLEKNNIIKKFGF